MFRPSSLQFTATAVATRRHTSSQNILRRNRWPDILIPKSIIDLKNRAPKIVRKNTLLFTRVIKCTKTQIDFTTCKRNFGFSTILWCNGIDLWSCVLAEVISGYCIPCCLFPCCPWPTRFGDYIRDKLSYVALRVSRHHHRFFIWFGEKPGLCFCFLTV